MNMSKQELINKMKESELELIPKVVVCASSALVMYDIELETRTNRIECYVKKDYYDSFKEELTEKGYEFKRTEFGECVVNCDGIHIHFNKLLINSDYNTDLDSGIDYSTPEALLNEYGLVRKIFKDKYDRHCAKMIYIKNMMELNNINNK